MSSGGGSDSAPEASGSNIIVQSEIYGDLTSEQVDFKDYGT